MKTIILLVQYHLHQIYSCLLLQGAGRNEQKPQLHSSMDCKFYTPNGARAKSVPIKFFSSIQVLMCSLVSFSSTFKFYSTLPHTFLRTVGRMSLLFCQILLSLSSGESIGAANALFSSGFIGKTAKLKSGKRSRHETSPPLSFQFSGIFNFRISSDTEGIIRRCTILMKDVVSSERREVSEGIINKHVSVVFAIHIFVFGKNIAPESFP